MLSHLVLTVLSKPRVNLPWPQLVRLKMIWRRENFAALFLHCGINPRMNNYLGDPFCSYICSTPVYNCHLWHSLAIPVRRVCMEWQNWQHHFPITDTTTSTESECIISKSLTFILQLSMDYILQFIFCDLLHKALWLDPMVLIRLIMVLGACCFYFV